MITLHFMITVVELSMLYTLLAMGTWLSWRVLNKYDLSIEGSFCLGGTVAALLLVNQINPWLALGCSLVVGAFIGSISFFLHRALGIDILMCGIVVNPALFSLALLLVGSHVSLGASKTIFTDGAYLFGSYGSLVIVALIVLTLIFLIKWLLTTEVGLVLRAVGDNANLVAELGKSVGCYQLATFMVANGLSGLTGALFVQYMGFFSVWSGIGTLVIALTAVLGARLVGKGFGLNLLLGSFFYQLITALTLEIDIRPEWHKLIAALLTVILMVVVGKDKND